MPVEGKASIHPKIPMQHSHSVVFIVEEGFRLAVPADHANSNERPDRPGKASSEASRIFIFV